MDGEKAIKNFVVTGASKGIGAGIAILLARKFPSSRVFIGFNSDRKGAEEVALQVEKEGSKAVTVGADVGTEIGCLRFRDAVVSSGAKNVDALVNNAALTDPINSVRETNCWKEMHKHFAANLFGMSKLTALCVPLLEASSGSPCIVNISSCTSKWFTGANSFYVGTKGAMDSLTRFQARELAPKIRVNLVHPGYIDTPIQAFAPSGHRERTIAVTPLKRAGTPEDIAEAVLFLINNIAMTASTVHANGGLMMYS